MKNSFFFTVIVVLSIVLFGFSNSDFEETGKKYCFELENERYSNHIIITFSEDDKVEGMLNVYVHDEEMDYQTSSFSKFTGVIEGKELKVDLLIEIEDNEIEESEIWIYKDEFIIVNDNIYKKVDCKKYEE